MKKFKGFICATGFVLCGFILSACGNTVDAKSKQKDLFEFAYVNNDSSDFYTYIMKDKEKGVEYIVVAGFSYGDGRSVAITPRLDNK